ncbi:hypothetical protein BHE74_00035756 [Ensete ventricosum]|nr:hypothetical protein BHE74_00035756 [Ensete ventricosum]
MRNVEEPSFPPTKKTTPGLAERKKAKAKEMAPWTPKASPLMHQRVGQFPGNDSGWRRLLLQLRIFFVGGVAEQIAEATTVRGRSDSRSAKK